MAANNSEFPLPDTKTKRHIFKLHTSRMSLADDVDLEELVMTKDDLSGADIKAVCTEAGLLALRERRMRVTKEDFTTAREKVLYRKDENTVSCVQGGIKLTSSLRDCTCDRPVEDVDSGEVAALCMKSVQLRRGAEEGCGGAGRGARCPAETRGNREEAGSGSNVRPHGVEPRLSSYDLAAEVGGQS